MEFRLTYQGILTSSGNTPKGKCKHAIRRYFHKQLVNLWNTVPLLQMALNGTALLGTRYQAKSDAEALIEKYQLGGKRYLPLICHDTGLTCSVEILLLRRDLGTVLVSGDLDGRIKTLIDALRIPIPGEDAEDGDEDPLYCLMSDDKLVSEIKVTADHLFADPEQVIEHPKLTPGNEYKINKNHVLAVVHVTTRTGMDL